MKRKIPFPAYLTSTWLLLHTLMISFNASLKLTDIVFSLSPFFMVWMVFAVLKSKAEVKELAKDEEWGYADKKKEELNMF